eukprot:CAMPEP_0197846354 /NCGR_PEP_ID=MMETSP1438-20131217/3106_1 /TAXON_ID=1461541 /ORGANISM="Pterosperma sp., Strain CCMP1384" /LENGTH=825 /DNA_ID=CAMNT_0043457965 /DNA_START=38 /DNA_END=2515 /DNA_ORIENTATION=+
MSEFLSKLADGGKGPKKPSAPGAPKMPTRPGSAGPSKPSMPTKPGSSARPASPGAARPATPTGSGRSSMAPAGRKLAEGVKPRQSIHEGSGSSSGNPGRVRVALRVRPMNKEETETQAAYGVETEQETSKITLKRNQWDEDHFTFDAVFAEHASQQRVYEAVAEPIVESVLKGFNGTVMAYGQTGTGKTHTLGNLGLNDVSSQGIMLRSVAAIFDAAANDEEGTYTVTASYLQLYMETVQDLWDPKNQDINIQEDRATGEVLLEPKPMTHKLKDLQHFVGLMQEGEKHRTVANHKLNAHSSRSHAVLMVTVQRSDAPKDAVRATSSLSAPTLQRGKLLLVDLAGSERQKSTGASGQVLEESKFINLSLTSLGKCINCLVDPSQASHVPYRESKLTRLVKDSFGGTARTSLVVTVGPAVTYYNETSNTIKFGQRAIKIENSLRKRELIDYKGLCKQQQQQVDLLTAALENSELDKEEAQQNSAALQAMLDKESEIERKAAEEMEKLRKQIEEKQKEMEMEKHKHDLEMSSTKAGMAGQMEALQKQIEEQLEVAAQDRENLQEYEKKAMEAQEQAKEAEERAQNLQEKTSSLEDQKKSEAEKKSAEPVTVIKYVKEKDPQAVLREKKLENVLMILQRELIDLKGKIDDMEAKHKEELTTCHQSWQNRLIYELKTKDKQIEHLQKTVEGCKAALSNQQNVQTDKNTKLGRTFLDKVLGRKNMPAESQPTKWVRLSGMFNPVAESSPKWVEEVKADVCSSCSIFGSVEDVKVDTQNSKGLIYIQFGNQKTAHRAVIAIKGHLGDIQYEFLPETQWAECVQKLTLQRVQK